MTETPGILCYHAREGRVFGHSNDTVVVTRKLLRTAADEIECLRIALRKIAQNDYDETDKKWRTDTPDMIWQVVARRALDAK